MPKTDKPAGGTQLHWDVFNLWVEGKRNHEIMEQLDCSYAVVKRVKADENMRREYYKQQAAQVADLVPLAVQRLASLLNDPTQTGSVHVAAAREILDRSNLKEIVEGIEGAGNGVKVVISYE